MIVDKSHRLHESICRGRSDELPAHLLQVFGQGNRCRRCRGALWFSKLCRVWLVSPEKGCQRAFLFDQLTGLAGIIDDRFDLAAVSDDAFIIEQARYIKLAEARDPVEIKTVEGGAEILALGEDGAPAQPD